jgi:hypothetical protein
MNIYPEIAAATLARYLLDGLHRAEEIARIIAQDVRTALDTRHVTPSQVA